MAKRGNNSLGRRAYGGKPYDANNSFVKKMATKVTDFIPQPSWISKWFNSSEDNNGETNENPMEGDTEEEVQPPASKRPRIRMDVTHPPGTFSIQSRARETANDNHSRKDAFSQVDETGEDFLEPPVAGPSGVRRFVASTPAVPTEVRNATSQRSDLNSLMPSQNNRATNGGADDNSESSESTSGCSSLIPQTNRQEAPASSGFISNLASRKRMIDDKLSFTNHLQSPRSLFLETASSSRDSLSSRRPSFNASMMSNNTLSNRSSSLSSPFYTGNVTFGGSNALNHYKPSRSLFNNSNSGAEFQLKVPRRTSVQVKPSSSESVDSSGMSQTAKRILEAMEYFSSPISDAKKIPIKNNSPLTSTGKKRLREDDSHPEGATSRVGLRHLTRELSVPTVPEMLKLRRRQKLQDTTMAARKIVSAKNSAPNSSIPNSKSSQSLAPVLEEYHLRTDRDDNPKFQGKLRTKLKKSTEEEGPPPIVNLPRISLPITSLPSFEPLPNFAKPPSLPNNRELPANSTTKETFKFASPIKIHEAAWNLKSINNFSFSKPLTAEEVKDEERELNKSNKTLSVDSNSSFSSETVATNFLWQGSSTAPRLKLKAKVKDKDNSVVKETELKTGSVMDILGSKPTKTSSDTLNSEKTSTLTKTSGKIWECSDCYIKNEADKSTCVACKASRPSVSPKAPSKASTSASSIITQPRNEGFGSQFKMSTDQWECQSCLVRNKMSDPKCVSCSTPKSSEKSATTASSTPASISSTNSSLMDNFKPPEGSWECPGCMLRNPAAVITCPCCKAAKPSLLKVNPTKTNEKTEKNSDASSETKSLLEKFKPPASTWECSSCMVRNSETATSCVCCSNPKPGSSAKKRSSCSEQPSSASGWGEKFAKPKDHWSCDTCLVQNKSSVTECVACGGLKPGAVAKPAAGGFSFGIPSTTQSFSFGIDKANEAPKEAKNQSTSNGFSFGVKAPSTSSDSSAKFTFGIPKDAEKSEKSAENSEKPGGFVFAAPQTASAGFKFETPKQAEENKEVTKQEEKKAESIFSFGLPTVVKESPKASESKSIFGGNAPAANGKPHFVFGMPEENSSSEAKAPKMSFGGDSEASKTPTSSSEASQGAKSETSKPEVAKSEPSVTSVSSSFATSSTSNPTSQAPTPFAFSEPKAKATPEPPKVTFGKNSTTPVTSGFSMASSKIETPSPFEAASKMKTPSPFGEPQSSSQSSGATEAKTGASGVFGSLEKKPSFFEMATSDKKISAFGAPEKKTPVFGAPTDAKPAFGTAEKPADAPMFNSPSPAFGSPAASSSQTLFGNNSTTPVFGTNSIPSFGQTPAAPETPSIFAAKPPSATPALPNSEIFTFGATNSQQTPSIGSFNFIPGSTGAAMPSKSLFTFGAAAQTAPPAQTPSRECFGSAGANPAVPTFGAPAASPANPTPSPFTFNAPPKQDAPQGFGQGEAIPNLFGTQTQGIGQAPAPQPASTGFSFGATAPSTAQPGVFTFGAGMPQPSPTPTAGFNFNAPAPSPTISFDPNTRPSFNFTGGAAPTAFSATPQPAPPRKIKKAVRRMPQR